MSNIYNENREVFMINFFDWMKLRENDEEMTTVTPTKPTTIPKPTKPSKPSPFNPKPRPIHEPKAKKRRYDESKKKINFKEVYDRDTKPFVKNFFSGLIRGGNQTPLHQNPVTALHGERLVKKHYDDVRPKYDEQGFHASDSAISQIIQEISSIQKIEARHKTRLEQEAISLVSEHTGIPEDRFRAFLDREITGGSPYSRKQRELANRGQEDDEGFEGEEEGGEEDMQHGAMRHGHGERRPENNLRHHINRLTTLNLLSQGHGLSTIDSLHFKIKEILDGIDPRLSPMYKKVGIGFKGVYFFTNVCEAMQRASARTGGAVGEEEVRFEPQHEGAGPEGEGEGEKVGIVYASGMCFPILIQELVKGAMDLVTTHANENLNDEELRIVKKHTGERYQDEPWHFMIGPPLWKEFLKFVPEQYRQGEKLMTVIMQLARKDPKFINDSIRHALDEMHATNDTTEIKRIITELMEELEDDGEQYNPHNDEN